MISLCRLFQSVMNEEALLGVAMRMSQECKSGSESAVTADCKKRPMTRSCHLRVAHWQAATANSCASKDAQVAEAREWLSLWLHGSRFRLRLLYILDSCLPMPDALFVPQVCAGESCSVPRNFWQGEQVLAPRKLSGMEAVFSEVARLTVVSSMMPACLRLRGGAILQYASASYATAM